MCIFGAVTIHFFEEKTDDSEGNLVQSQKKREMFGKFDQFSLLSNHDSAKIDEKS